MNSDSEDSESNLLRSSSSPNTTRNQSLPVQTSDLALSKNSFQQMLMNFNNRVVNTEKPIPVKTLAPVKGILKNIKTEKSRKSFDLQTFNPVASSTQNYSQLFADFLNTPERSHIKKHTLKLEHVEHEEQELLNETVSVASKKVKKRKREVLSEGETELKSTKRKHESDFEASTISKLEAILEKFESDNNLIKDDDAPGISKDLLSDRYETFLIQIPKTFDPKTLVGLELSLNGKTRIKYDGVKYDCVSTPCEEPATLLNNNQLMIIHPKTSIIIKQHMKHKHLPDAVERSNNNVAFPNDLKERHPLFGADYLKNISLEEHIREKLKAAVEANERRKQKEKEIKVEASQLGSKSQEEEIFKLLNETSPSKKSKKSKKNVSHVKEEPQDDIINEILLSKSLELSGEGIKRKKHKKKHSFD